MTFPITLEKQRYKGWDAWIIRRAELGLVLVPQIGGRIMGLLWRDHDLFFTDPSREGQEPTRSTEADVAQQKRALGFPLWGGDKTWLAPQARWRDNAPFFDLDSGPYDLNLDAEQADLIQITMSSRMCRESGMQVRRTVRVSADLPGWTVRHEMRNVSTHPAEWELWDVAMVGRPGVVYLPRSAGSAYPEGVRTYDHEGSSANVRERVVRTMGTVASVDCRQSAAFKFGVDGSEGWIAALIEQPDGTLIGYRKEVPVYPNGAYAHGCVAEVYNSNGYAYFEIELHGPTVELQPGEHFAIEEQQCVADVHRWPATGAEARAVGIAQ